MMGDVYCVSLYVRPRKKTLQIVFDWQLAYTIDWILARFVFQASLSDII